MHREHLMSAVTEDLKRLNHKITASSKSKDVSSLLSELKENRRLALFLLTKKSLTSAFAGMVSYLNEVEDKILAAVNDKLGRGHKVKLERKNVTQVAGPNFSKVVEKYENEIGSYFHILEEELQPFADMKDTKQIATKSQPDQLAPGTIA